MRHLILLFKESPNLTKLLIVCLLFGDEFLLLLLPFANIAFPPLIQELLFGASFCQYFKLMVEKGGNILLNRFWKSLPISGHSH